MWGNMRNYNIGRTVLIGVGAATGAGFAYSMYQKRKDELADFSVHKAQERDVPKVLPPTIERPEVRSKIQGSTAEHETAHKLKGARDYAVGAVETTVKDAAKAAKESETKSKLQEATEYAKGYKDRVVGAVETTAKDFAHSVKHARDESRHKHQDLSERMKNEKEHVKHNVDRDIGILESKAKNAEHKVSDTLHKGADKIEYGAQKAKSDIVTGAKEAKDAVVHGAEVAMDKTKVLASDIAKKAEHAKDVTVNKTEELAEKSKEASKDLLHKSKIAADKTVAVAKEVGSVTAAKTKEAASAVIDTTGDVFLKTGKAAESVVKPVAGTVVNATEQVGEKYEHAKDHLYDIVKDARDKAAAKKAEADIKRNAAANKKQIEKEIENVNDIQRY